MDLETADKVKKHLSDAEQERLGYMAVGREGAPEQRLQALFDTFGILKAAVEVCLERQNIEEIRVSGNTPGGSHAVITLKRFYSQETAGNNGNGARRYYGIDAEITCGGFPVATENINDKALTSTDERKLERDLSNLEETFTAAMMFVGMESESQLRQRL